MIPSWLDMACIGNKVIDIHISFDALFIIAAIILIHRNDAQKFLVIASRQMFSLTDSGEEIEKAREHSSSQIILRWDKGHLHEVNDAR